MKTNYLFKLIIITNIFFSLNLLALDFLVTNTNDSGPGSLRQAILDANANPGLDRIIFNIPGAGPHIIAPLTVLPDITDPIIIDGSNIIILDGINLGTGEDLNGLNLIAGSSGSTIAGLTIQRFGEDGIRIASNANTITRNIIGSAVDPLLGNGDDGIFIFEANSNIISCNVIAHNGRFATQGPILGAGVGLGDTVAASDNAILSNSIFNNNTSGIAFNGAANHNQAAPILTSAEANGVFVTITGTLTSVPNSNFTIQFFTNTVNRNPITEGQNYIGQIQVTTDAAGIASFSATLASTAILGQFVSATATRLGVGLAGETSEYSLSRELNQGLLITPIATAIFRKYCALPATCNL